MESLKMNEVYIVSSGRILSEFMFVWSLCFQFSFIRVYFKMYILLCIEKLKDVLKNKINREFIGYIICKQ